MSKKQQQQTEVIWQEPEASYRGGRYYSRIDEIISTLKSQPNRWALISDKPKPTTLNPKFRSKDFERAYRTVQVEGKNRYRTYARFVGGK